jgi:hypothetical protein
MSLRNIYSQDGTVLAQVDDKNRIVTGHHRVEAHRRLGLPMQVLDESGKLMPATFADDK